MSETTYKIVRFHFQGGSEVVKTGLTLDEAQAHCKRADTHGPDWFDGYEAEESYLSSDDWDQGIGITESCPHVGAGGRFTPGGSPASDCACQDGA